MSGDDRILGDLLGHGLVVDDEVDRADDAGEHRDEHAAELLARGILRRTRPYDHVVHDPFRNGVVHGEHLHP